MLRRYGYVSCLESSSLEIRADFLSPQEIAECTSINMQRILYSSL